MPALLAGSCTICPFSIPLCPSLLPTLSAVLCRVLSLSSAPVSAPWCRVWQQLSGLADGIVKTVGNFAVWKFVPLVNNTATYAPVEWERNDNRLRFQRSRRRRKVKGNSTGKGRKSVPLTSMERDFLNGTVRCLLHSGTEGRFSKFMAIHCTKGFCCLANFFLFSFVLFSLVFCSPPFVLPNWNLKWSIHLWLHYYYPCHCPTVRSIGNEPRQSAALTFCCCTLSQLSRSETYWLHFSFKCEETKLHRMKCPEHCS